jgi:hypothetical protein
MNFTKVVAFTVLGISLGLLLAGCDSQPNAPKSLDEERVAARGSTPPADAGEKYLEAQRKKNAAANRPTDPSGATLPKSGQ